MSVVEREASVWRWDVEKVQFAVRAGLLDEDARLELLEGELIDKMPQTDIHESLVSFLSEALRAAFGQSYFVKPGAPIRLGPHSEPEPDVTVVRGPYADFLGRKAGPDDIVLLMEVSYSTRRTDLGRKKALYARHGIAEYQVLDLENNRLEIFTRPDPSGEYLEHRTVLANGEIPRLGLVLGPLLAKARGEVA